MPQRSHQPRIWPGRVHRRGANVLFCDGHVEWLAQEELIIDSGYHPKQAHRRRRWNNDNEPNWD